MIKATVIPPKSLAKTEERLELVFPELPRIGDSVVFFKGRAYPIGRVVFNPDDPVCAVLLQLGERYKSSRVADAFRKNSRPPP